MLSISLFNLWPIPPQGAHLPPVMPRVALFVLETKQNYKTQHFRITMPLWHCNDTFAAFAAPLNSDLRPATILMCRPCHLLIFVENTKVTSSQPNCTCLLTRRAQRFAATFPLVPHGRTQTGTGRRVEFFQRCRSHPTLSTSTNVETSSTLVEAALRYHKEMGKFLFTQLTVFFFAYLFIKGVRSLLLQYKLNF